MRGIIHHIGTSAERQDTARLRHVVSGDLRNR
jgi:hypothetical protein